MPKKKPMTKIVRQLRSGQITIPSEFRQELGIDEHAFLQITLAQGELRIKPVRVSVEAHGSVWLKDLYDYFAPAREQASTFSEEEINADIDKAVRQVRKKNVARSL